MKIKTFYAQTMAEAMQEIKAALGADALLLSTKEIPSRSGAGGLTSGFEVVAASDESTPADPASDSAAAQLESPEDGGYPRAAFLQIGDEDDPDSPLTYSPELLRKISSSTPPAKGSAITRAPKPRVSSFLSAPTAEPLPFADALSLGLYSSLLESGVEGDLARRLLVEGRDLVPIRHRRARNALLRGISQAAQGLICHAPLPAGIPSQRLVVFVGPTGVGKTTSIAKLAARLALREKKNVVLVTLDGYRIGAVEQLRTYANLIGVPFRFVPCVADLPQALQEHGQRDFILIDTAGRAPNQLGGMQDLMEFLSASDQIERHLVLSATTKAQDLHEIVDRFEMFHPDRLLFTKLDETSTLGPILNELVRSRKPMSYYSDGQRVPEDLHTAPAEQILEIVLSRN